MSRIEQIPFHPKGLILTTSFSERKFIQHQNYFYEIESNQIVLVARIHSDNKIVFLHQLSSGFAELENAGIVINPLIRGVFVLVLLICRKPRIKTQSEI